MTARSAARNVWIAAFVGLGLLWPREGRVGQEHMEEVSLQQVVAAATVVVVAHRAEPASTTVEVPYTGELSPGQEVPPFRTGVSHYVAQSVPHGAGVAEKARLDVWHAGTRQRQEDHFDYYVHGISKHSIHARYTPSYGADPEPSPVVLLLAPRDGGGWWLYGTEAPTKLPDILALVKPAAGAPPGLTVDE